MLLVGEPSLGEDEKQALADVVDANWITMGDRVRAFEAAFAAIHGAADAVAVSSCTAGLHLLLAAHGFGPGDEVLVPSLSFVATANCILYVGATPVFVDIEDIMRPVMSMADAEAKCTPRTRGIIIMHYAGFVLDRAAWRGFAIRHGLVLIEDAAHAAGVNDTSDYKASAVFSFYGNKNMTTAEGGMVVSDTSEILDRVRLLRGHGMTSSTQERHDARTPTYDVTALGWNYRMDEFRAAVGLVQLQSLRKWNAARAELTKHYWARIAESCANVSLPFAETNESSAYHLLPVILPKDADRSIVMARLRDTGVQSTIHYPPIHRMTYYRQHFPDISLPCTENFACRQLTLPLHPKMHLADVEHVVKSLAIAL